MKKTFLFLIAIISGVFIFGQTVVVETNPTSPWTVPAGVTSVKVECWGGGGGGGGANGFTKSGGGGGGGGAYQTTTYSVSSGLVLTVVVGAGGAGGGGGNNGINGNVSSVTGTGVSVVANNGLKGNGAGSNSVGAGGAGGTGTTNGTAGSGGSKGNRVAGGNGGNGGSGGAYASGAGGGNTGNIPGGGGGGGGQGGMGSRDGGAGASGKVVLTYTLPALPITPGTPTSNSPNCSSVTITRNGTPPAGEVWYWQTSASGELTSSSGTTYTASSSGTYYIRSRRTSDLVWSDAASITVVVNNVPAAVTTPSPANGATGVCFSGVGVVTSISWAASATATSYDVYFGAGSLPGTVTTNVATNSYVCGTLLSNTTYYWKVIAKNGCGSATASTWSFTTSSVPCYCASASGNCTNEYITNVTYSGINNTTVSSFYSDYSGGTSASVTRGVASNLSVKVMCDGTEYVYAWIDWNNDGDFVDAGEAYNLGTTSTDNAILTVSITPPVDAFIGKTKMRISEKYNAAPTPCETSGTFLYGEVEDYSVIVVQPAYAAQYISQNTGSSNWCAGETRTVSVTIKNTGTQPWTDGGGEDFNIGIKWNAEPDYIRVDAQNLASGATKTYNFTVTAPSAGASNLTFNIVREGIAWFGGAYASSAITINALPTSVNAGSDVTICSGSSTPLSGSATAVSPPYFTSFDGCNSPNCGGWNLSGGYGTPSITSTTMYQATPCNNSAAMANLYSDAITTTLSSTSSLGTSLGLPATLSFNYKCTNYNAGTTATPANSCTFTAYWATSASGTWNTISSFNNASTASCISHTFTSFTPSSGQAIFIKIVAVLITGDFVVVMDDISLTQNNVCTYSWTPSTGLSATNIANPTASPTTSTTYTMSATANGCSATDEVTVNVNSLSTAPTSISGTTPICSGGSTTLTANGGTLGTGANNVWYEGACVTEAYNQQWESPPASVSNTTVNSCNGGILNVTSSASSSDPMIHMYSIGSWNPLVYKYINVRYRVISGTAGSCEIFFTNTSYPAPTGSPDYANGALNSDGSWHVLTIDMPTVNAAVNGGTNYWNAGGNITGWRFDWATANNVTMDIDYITLTDKPIIGEGNSITVSPTTNTTYYTAKKGECNTTSCASKTVTVNEAPTAPTSITGTSTICSGSTTTLTASGGSEGAGCIYQWGTGSSVGSSIIAGENNASYTTVSLNSNTTYWVRRIGNTSCTNTTGGTSQLITVNATPTAPTSISGTTTINLSQSTTLTASGGSEGAGCTYEWFDDGCGSGLSLGSNSSLMVFPTSTTTYFVRRVGSSPCANTTSCAQVTVIVNLPSSTWTGAINTDWNTAGNWNPASVPTSSNSAIIPNVPNKPIVNLSKLTPAQCNNLTINSGSSITINKGKALTVNSDLLNNGTITIKSDATDDGSLIVIGSLTGSGVSKIERYLIANRWHLVTSPITNGLAGVFQGIWLRPFDEPTNTFGAYITPLNTPMPSGQGFSVWSNTNQSRTFSGTFNHGDIGPLNLSLTNVPSANTGWNLLGNPYPSAIDWDSPSGWTKNNIANAVYVWNGTQYATYVAGVGQFGGSRYIAMGQGFLVQATNNTASVTIKNTARTHNSVAFMKNNDVNNVIRINLFNQNYSDETVIAIRDEAIDEFDANYDAYKMYGSYSAPQMFTTKNQIDMYSIQSLNSIQKVVGKVVFIEYPEWGEYNMVYTHTIDGNYVPVLYDNVAENVVNPNLPYSFIASPNDPKSRFQFIEPSNTTNIKNPNANNINVWENDDVVYILVRELEKLSNVKIFDLSGKIVYNGNQSKINVDNLASGSYIVNVVTDKQTLTKKIILK